MKTKSKIQTIAAASIIVLCFILGLSKYSSGTGIDTKLETKDEFSYRVSLDRAWMEMSDEQKMVYSWAVEKYTLTQLLAKYPEITPRKVIKREVDELLLPQEKKLAELRSYVSANKQQLERMDVVMREARHELAKITITTSEDEHMIMHNGSRFDISFSEWVVLFSKGQSLLTNAVENQECYRFSFSSVVKSETKTLVKEEIESEEGKLKKEACFMALGLVSQLEGKFPFTLTFKLNVKSVKNHNGDYIVPDAPIISDYEKSISNTLKEIEFLKKKKSVLG